MRVFDDRIGPCEIEARTRCITKSEVEILQSAFTFAEKQKDLFNHINKSACRETHQANVYLCGLQSNQLKASISTCQGNQWISATFKRFETSVTSPPAFEHYRPRVRRSIDDEQLATPFLPAQFCEPTTVPKCQPEIKHIVFNETAMWEQHNTPNPEPEPSTPNNSLKTLLGSQYFSPKNRELLSYLLASALFRLYGSPWIRKRLGDDTVFLYPRDRGSRFHQWRPHVHCALASTENGRNDQNNREYMAAFGVLVMELQAGESAEWTDDDLDWDTNTKSNQVRLGRILQEWKEMVPDGYRHVSRACHEFERLIGSFPDNNVACHLKSLAIVYKCILEPLFHILERNFGGDAQLFKGIPSLREGLSPSKAAEQKSFELFDDLDMEGSYEK